MTFSDLDFLLLYKIETMTDQLFAEILAQNQLLSLNNVVFDHCQAITSATIWKVIKINLSTSSSTLSRRRVKKMTKFAPNEFGHSLLFNCLEGSYGELSIKGRMIFAKIRFKLTTYF